MEKLILFIVKELVANPDAVAVEVKSNAKKININVSVLKSDIGKVIGRNASVINAIRTIAKNLNPNQRVYVNVGEKNA